MMNRLIAVLSSLSNHPGDKALIGTTLTSLDEKYALSRKMDREAGLAEIIKQLVGRICQTYNPLSTLRGKRILDIAAGSNTSKSPSFVYVNTPFGEQQIHIPSPTGYTAQFEPWFCRMLLELGTHPVGIDLGNLVQLGGSV